MRDKILLTLFALFFMSGCSDENKEVRGDFLAGCVQSGASKSICSCAFEKLEEKYTPQELSRLNSPMATPSEEFMKDVLVSAIDCRNE